MFLYPEVERLSGGVGYFPSSGQLGSNNMPAIWALVTTFLSKSLQIINARKGMEKMEPLCEIGRNVNCYNCYGEQYETFLKN